MSCYCLAFLPRAKYCIYWRKLAIYSEFLSGRVGCKRTKQQKNPSVLGLTPASSQQSVAFPISFVLLGAGGADEAGGAAGAAISCPTTLTYPKAEKWEGEASSFPCFSFQPSPHCQHLWTFAAHQWYFSLSLSGGRKIIRERREKKRKPLLSSCIAISLTSLGLHVSGGGRDDLGRTREFVHVQRVESAPAEPGGRGADGLGRERDVLAHQPLLERPEAAVTRPWVVSQLQSMETCQ